MARPSWGHISRHCVRCGKVGPRINDEPRAHGWVHLYCLSDEEKAARRQRHQAEHAASREAYVQKQLTKTTTEGER